MRKVLICEHLTAEIQNRADLLGIGELIIGVPPIMVGAIGSTPLPVVVVESATQPYTFLLTANAMLISKAELDALVDLPARTQLPFIGNRVTTLEQVMTTKIALTDPKIILIDTLKAEVDLLKTKVTTIEGKLPK